MATTITFATLASFSLKQKLCLFSEIKRFSLVLKLAIFFLIAVQYICWKNNHIQKKYEEYTSFILNDSSVHQLLEKYNGTVNIKVKSLANLELEDWNLKGEKTGCIWNVDGFGYDISGECILVECKHSSTRKIEQNELAAFAYVIKDVGAKAGIIVTTLGLQSGAKQIAKSEDIGLLILDYNSTDKNFKITFNTLNEPTQENSSHSIMALTDEIHLGFDLVSSSVVITYPLEEALQRLRQKTNRVNFSEAEIIEEAKRMVEEASNE